MSSEKFGSWDLPNSIRSLRPLLADLWETKRGIPNPNLAEWGLPSLSHAELLMFELVGQHEDFGVLRDIHEGEIREGTFRAYCSAGWHSIETYAKDSGYQPRQARALLQALTQKGYITTWDRGISRSHPPSLNGTGQTPFSLHSAVEQLKPLQR